MTPATSAKQELLYVRSSQPHTGALVEGHVGGEAVHYALAAALPIRHAAELACRTGLAVVSAAGFLALAERIAVQEVCAYRVPVDADRVRVLGIAGRCVAHADRVVVIVIMAIIVIVPVVTVPATVPGLDIVTAASGGVVRARSVLRRRAHGRFEGRSAASSRRVGGRRSHGSDQGQAEEECSQTNKHPP